jgi:FdrA protein
MAIRALVLPSCYRDSVVLMGVAAEMRALTGVREAAALMGTAANHELLASAGLAATESRGATPSDLVLAVDAADDVTAEAALVAARARLEEGQRTREMSGTTRPRTLETALRQRPDANLVAISVPGEYARREALSALRHGRHVFLFSDNVSLADEIELKRLAVSRGLFCMGPDCGTAYLGGVGLGFANEVPTGRVGCIAASGTGLQAVASHLAGLGEGISHGIGVGGRDVSAAVGGVMTTFALDALARDPATEVIVLITKPPAPEVLAGLEAALRAVVKPVVVCALGAVAGRGAPGTWVSTLEDAAAAASAAVHGRRWTPRAFADAAAVRGRLAALESRPPASGALLGLFTGGTLAHEARLLLEPLLGPVAGNLDPSVTAPHHILDLGADEFTRGRPHPMIDTAARDARVREAGHSADVGVLLLDLVLGRAAHPDPARSLAPAAAEARAAAAGAGRALVMVASIVGTDGDPQGLDAQRRQLEAAGIEVLPSSAQAARFAGLVLRPDRIASLLGVEA